jgi:hypothetical protein
MPLGFTPLLLRLKLLRVCDQWHSSRAFTPLTVATINCAQTLKATATQGAPLTLTLTLTLTINSCRTAEGKRGPVLVVQSSIASTGGDPKHGARGLTMDSVVVGLASPLMVNVEGTVLGF